MAIAFNAAIIVFELIGLRISALDRKWMILVYYTQLSNIITLFTSCVFVVTGSNAVTITLRYVSTCMLTMTLLVSLFVLVPMGAGFKNMMLSGNGLYHHTICPILSFTSYYLWEEHSHLWILPVILTFVYGVVMLILNGTGKYDGPYPFFRIHKQSKAATVMWIIILIAIIAGISILISSTAI